MGEKKRKSTFATQTEGIPSLPVGTTRATSCFVEQMTLAKTTRAATSRGKAAHLTVLVHWSADPVGLGVTTDGFVEGVDQDHLKELVGGVLTHPVGAQDTQTSTATANTLLEQNNSKANRMPQTADPPTPKYFCQYSKQPVSVFSDF